MIGFLRERMEQHRHELAIAQPGSVYTYADLLSRVDSWEGVLSGGGVPAGSVVSVEGEYGIETISLFLALMSAGAISVPLSRDSIVHAEAFMNLADVEYRAAPEGGRSVQPTGRLAAHPLYGVLRERKAPGLVLFSSGSTGASKAAVHDLGLLLRKFEKPRHRYRTLAFLQLDHIGGVNTLFYTLSNGGAVVVPADRSPARVAEVIERHRVELLPTSPTFLNLLLLSGAHEQRDLSSLRLITYGTEPMPESTLRKAAETFPQARLQQTYGLTEVGILRSQSRGSGSLWVRVGGEGYQTKVVDGRLWVKAESAMLGYLNAPSPFDADGFLDTGDRVEVDGEWLRILGRETDIINVGGSKVYPAEVESVLLQLENVADVAVHGESHPITGQMVVATVRLTHDEPASEFKVRLRRFCRDTLAPYKVPAKVVLATGPLYSERFKRVRPSNAQTIPVRALSPRNGNSAPGPSGPPLAEHEVPSRFRTAVKSLVNAIALVLVFPCALTCWLEARLAPPTEHLFGFWSNVFALLPGLPGMYLRRAFYHLTLDSCSLDCYIGFGAMFTHRRVIVEDHVHVGPYCLVGSAKLRRGSLVGSRASLLSGPALHEMDAQGHWTPADLSKLRQIEIGEDVWIGEGAIVMVNVGAGSLVGTGAVVSTRVRPGVVVAGNPARFVRRLKAEAQEPADKGEQE